MEITLTKDNFEEKVLKADLPVLVDFWAPWCGPCLAVAPAISEIANELDGKAIIGKLNVDENPETAQTYGVSSIPNLKIFKGGQIVDEIIGAVPASEIKTALEKTL